MLPLTNNFSKKNELTFALGSACVSIVCNIELFVPGFLVSESSSFIFL
jgi:hypothetical protein